MLEINQHEMGNNSINALWNSSFKLIVSNFSHNVGSSWGTAVVIEILQSTWLYRSVVYVMLRLIMSEYDVVKGLRVVRERVRAASQKRAPVSKVIKITIFSLWQAVNAYYVTVVLLLHFHK